MNVVGWSDFQNADSSTVDPALCLGMSTGFPVVPMMIQTIEGIHKLPDRFLALSNMSFVQGSCLERQSEKHDPTFAVTWQIRYDFKSIITESPEG